MANIELLDKIIDKIQDEPKCWNQSIWAAKISCYTAYCIAGWACVLSDYEIAWQGSMADMVYVPHIGPSLIEDVAARLLEINWVSAKVLFSPANTLEDIIEMRKTLQEYGTLDSQCKANIGGDHHEPE